ncbi:hypothetical protein [Streptomyces sp. NPDC058657]|uniref:hypothetical protein n=1 Tax=unclassified Streptomyces TaxID=2593676 RepID=UPI003664AB33
MDAISTASRLVTAAAREALGPLGLQRHGRSRTWIDDHGWWLGIVEFQPSRNAGSYLNVGVMWLWQARDHLAYDVGGREPGFERFVNPTQFAHDAQTLARRAADLARENRARFADLPSTADFLTLRKPRPGYFWDTYHAGVLAGLTGDTSTARRRFGQVLAEDAYASWMVQAQESARRLQALAESSQASQASEAAEASEARVAPAAREAFREWATEAIDSCRQQLKLPTWAQRAAGGSYWS